MSNKIYQGRRFNPDDPLSEAIVTVNGRPLKHIVRHSPTGFNWGYAGSGPADTALSILTDVFEGNVELADIFYFDFKVDFVSTWDDDWKITEGEIDDWLKNRVGRGIQDLIQEFKSLDEEGKLNLRYTRKFPERR